MIYFEHAALDDWNMTRLFACFWSLAIIVFVALIPFLIFSSKKRYIALGMFVSFLCFIGFGLCGYAYFDNANRANVNAEVLLSRKRIPREKKRLKYDDNMYAKYQSHSRAKHYRNDYWAEHSYLGGQSSEIHLTPMGKYHYHVVKNSIAGDSEVQTPSGENDIITAKYHMRKVYYHPLNHLSVALKDIGL